MNSPKEIAPDVIWIRTGFVNCYLVGPTEGLWVLIDMGLPGFAKRVGETARNRYVTAPAAIILTHGHFDHAGNARELSDRWDTPVYCGKMERPYLTHQSPYPPPDPTTGGLLGMASRLFPKKGVGSATG